MLIERFDSNHPQANIALVNTFPFLENLDRFYPSISSWYTSSFQAGLLAGRNILLMAKSHDGTLLGVALGKKTGHETKMQCVRVAEQQANAGLGISLMDRMIEELECTTPFCTVSEEMLHQYSRIFVKRYGFTLDDVVKGSYRPKKLEYCFNGQMH